MCPPLRHKRRLGRGLLCRPRCSGGSEHRGVAAPPDASNPAGHPKPDGPRCLFRCYCRFRRFCCFCRCRRQNRSSRRLPPNGTRHAFKGRAQQIGRRGRSDVQEVKHFRCHVGKTPSQKTQRTRRHVQSADSLFKEKIQVEEGLKATRTACGGRRWGACHCAAAARGTLLP